MSTVHQVQSAGAKKKLRQCHRCHQQIQPGYPYQYLRRERRTLYFCHSHPVRPSDTLTGDERDLRFQVEQLHGLCTTNRPKAKTANMLSFPTGDG